VSVRLRHSDKRMLVMPPSKRSVLELRLSPMPRRRLRDLDFRMPNAPTRVTTRFSTWGEATTAPHKTLASYVARDNQTVSHPMLAAALGSTVAATSTISHRMRPTPLLPKGRLSV
jgi:hypothetical protein